MRRVKLNRNSIPGLYSHGESFVVVLPDTVEHGRVILKGTARANIRSVNSLNREYKFIKDFDKLSLEIK